MSSSSDNDNFAIEEDGSEARSSSNNSLYTNPTSLSLDDSTLFRESSSISSDSVFEETYTKKLDDRIRELKAELRTPCYANWLTKVEPAEQNPKIELNLSLHGVIREQTLKQLALSKSIHFRNDEKICAEIFENDSSVWQRIFQEIVHDQREQNIIYTEILFRPDIFNFDKKTLKTKLKDVVKIIVESIRFSTSTSTKKIEPKTTIKSSSQYGVIPFATHIKLILSCNWNNVKTMPQLIRLAREYPEEIVGIDFYGHEDDCRTYWHDFSEYTKILDHYHIRCQASLKHYQDLQLIEDVIKDFGIERIFDAYEIILSPEHMQNICVKRGIHLIFCPLSDAYTIAHQRIPNVLLDAGYDLINYSITSFSPREYQQNLLSIFKNLLIKNTNSFTCEHMQWLNENAIKASFASQKLKTEMMNYLRESYKNCYKQTLLIEQFQETIGKWQQEMSEIIDKNARTAVDFAKKMRKEKMLKRLNRQQENQTKIFEEANEEEESDKNTK